MRRGGVAGLALVMAVSLLWPAAGRAQDAGTPGAATVSSPEASPASGSGLEAAVAYLEAVQGDDGGFPGFEGTSDPGVTADATIALAAAMTAGVDAVDAIDRAVAYLDANAAAYVATGPGQRAKAVLAIVAVGLDPSLLGGEDQVEALLAAIPADGFAGSGIYDTALVTLALTGAGEGEAAADLAGRFGAFVTPDGSWAFDGSTDAGMGDTNTTALVVQALVATGVTTGPEIDGALAYLGQAQAADGGFAYQPADPLVPDANSTALVVQALAATGADMGSEAPAAAMAALAAFQNSSGAFRYTAETPEDNLFATVQAIPALAGLALPIVTGTSSGTPVASPAAMAAD
ncbi:MAG: terpene cyclase/mutase family protein [Chloroflexia bacterium]|nr:terpene cyclase/mutase family protein [Chloroflexia bacterium]